MQSPVGKRLLEKPIRIFNHGHPCGSNSSSSRKGNEGRRFPVCALFVSTCASGLVQVQLRLALIAFHGAAENPVAAFGADVAGLFVFNPFLSTKLASIWNRSKDNLLANSHREMIDMAAWKLIAFVAPVVASFCCAVSDLALPAMHEPFIGPAATASNILCGEGFAVWQGTFAGSPSPVQFDQPFLQFDVIVAVGDVNGANAAI